jgi:hypothetical protein
MRAESTIFVLALVCAFGLLFTPLSQRTMWYSIDPVASGGTASMRHSAGWDYVAPVCAFVALAGLIGGLALCPRVLVPVAGAIAAAGALGFAAGVTAVHYRDAVSGTLDLSGMETVAPPAAPSFAVLAVLGAGFALALAISWWTPTPTPARRR